MIKTQKAKKWIAGMAGAMMLTLCGTGMAFSAAAEPVDAGEAPAGGQRQEWIEKQQTAREKWQALTDQQKAEIYALLEGRVTADENLVDKLAQLGVLSSEDAARIKEHLREMQTKRQESGEFPLGGPQRREHKNRQQ